MTTAPVLRLAEGSDSDEHDRRRSRRAVRYALRDDVQMLSGLRRVAACGRASTGAGVSIVRSGEGVARYTGLQTCGSIWACPVCSAKIRQHRANELESGLRAHLEAGGGVYFLTLTLRHGPNMPLRETLRAVQDSYRSMLQGRRRVWALKSAARPDEVVVGVVRSTEVTKGPNGWHPHIHLLLLTSRPFTAVEEGRWSKKVYDAWHSAVLRRMPSCEPTEAGYRFERVRTGKDVALYVTKAALEMTRSDLKEAASRSRTPFEIAADAAALIRDHGPDALGASYDLWREYEQATYGVRAMSWSKGLRAYFLEVGAEIDGAEATDDDLAADAPAGPEDEVLASLSYRAWGEVLRRPGMRAKLLDLAEWGGREAVHRQLVALGCFGAHPVSGASRVPT